MKTVLLNSAIILFILSSCSSSKSFMHQRYTSLGHKKHSTQIAKSRTSDVASKKALSTERAVVINSSEVSIPQPEVIVTQPVNQKSELKSEKSAVVLTANAGSSKMTTTTASPKALNTNFVNHAAKAINKQVSKQNAKHGLLFGVIDALLSIILIVVVVAVIIFLILILI